MKDPDGIKVGQCRFLKVIKLTTFESRVAKIHVVRLAEVFFASPVVDKQDNVLVSSGLGLGFVFHERLLRS